MFNIGPEELILILVIALIVFGPKRLPEIGRTVGKGLREFRRASQDLRDQFEGGFEDDEDSRPEPPKVAGPPNVPEAETGVSPDGSGSSSLDGPAPTT